MLSLTGDLPVDEAKNVDRAKDTLPKPADADLSEVFAMPAPGCSTTVGFGGRAQPPCRHAGMRIAGLLADRLMGPVAPDYLRSANVRIRF